MSTHKRIGIFVQGIGSIKLELENRKIIVISVPKEAKRKFKEKNPGGVVDDMLDSTDKERLGQVLTRIIKSLR